MPNIITDQFQVKYTNKWGVMLQQMSSRIQEFTTFSAGLTGEVVYFDQFGLVDFEEKITRMGQTMLNEVPTDRRCIRPRMFAKAYGYDEFDANQLSSIELPVQKTIEGLRAAAARRMDDVMIEGFLGTNYVGKDGIKPVTLLDSQTIKVDYVESGTAAASNLTVAKLRAIVQKFQENEAWSDNNDSAGDKICMIVTPSQIMSLLREKEVSSYDFNTVKALVAGEVDAFMGIKFIRTQRLPKVGNVRTNLAWVKSKAQFGIWDDFKVKVSIRDDMDEALQVRARFACGATRLQEEGFVKVLCDETK